MISATLVSIKSSLGQPLTTFDKSIITSVTALFALLVSPVSGMMADALGRKRVVVCGDGAFILGAVIQAVAKSVWVMVVGRAIVGLAVGAGSFVVPLYIAELAPAPFRGRLVTLNILFVTVGQVVAYVMGWAFVNFGDEDTGWRWIVGLGAVPAVVQLLVMLTMPETPRWLVKVGRRDEARGVLNKVFGTGNEVQGMVDVVLKGIEAEVREEEAAKETRVWSKKRKDKASWYSDVRDTWDELLRIGGNRRALTIACLLQGLQQFCGFVSFSRVYILVEAYICVLELAHVLLRDYLYYLGVLKSHIDIYVRCNHQLPPHMRCSSTYRPCRETPYPSLLHSCNGPWSISLRPWLSLHHPAFRPQLRKPVFQQGRSHQHPALSTYHPTRRPRQHHDLRRRLCSRPRKRAMDAERAIPAQRTQFGIWSQHEHELGSKFYCGVDLFGDDGDSNAELDICGLWSCVCCGMGLDLVYLSRDDGLEPRGDWGFARGWLGGEGELEEG